MNAFSSLLDIRPETRVLDVGGDPGIWRFLDEPPRVTYLNLLPDNLHGSSAVVGDGCALPFRDGAFDVVFSNSVIEHVGGREAQRRFAQECARVGRRYYIQTPNRGFFFEPHLLAPFIHWLPLRIQRVLIRVTPRATLSGRREAEKIASHTRLISNREFRALFPDAQRADERFLGLRKSLIAVRV